MPIPKFESTDTTVSWIPSRGQFFPVNEDSYASNQNIRYSKGGQSHIAKWNTQDDDPKNIAFVADGLTSTDKTNGEAFFQNAKINYMEFPFYYYKDSTLSGKTLVRKIDNELSFTETSVDIFSTNAGFEFREEVN